ncbi:flavodoxin family protein [Candidatus Peribacteria bacterium]|nr:flavodoxin family protein [Candidatus Peribacteria bacterium]
MINILILVAGTNEPSNSNVLADAMEEGMRSVSDVSVVKFRLKDLQIRHFGLECYGPNCPIDDFEKVKKEILAADGVIIATPIWNFSVPAHLKNLIDRMGAFGLDSESHSMGMLHGKPFFLLFTGGTPLAAWALMKQTSSHIPVSLQYFGASILGTHFELRCTLGKGIFGLVVDKRPKSLEAVKRKGIAFAKAVQIFQRTGRLPLRHRLMQKFVQMAQRVKKGLGI